MSHDFHDVLPGYSPDQIWHDGCWECEARSADLGAGVGSLDTANFARAWKRAADWNLSGLPDMSAAEVPLLKALWAVQLQLERRGVPIGQVPTGLEAGWVA
jgi:hypothetical protein